MSEPPKSPGPQERREANQEAHAYYRERSRAPGVASGGAERNFYCMQCDGVIAHDHATPTCPHCGAAIDPHVRRYFNWVEINEPPKGDAAPLIRAALLILAVLALTALATWWIAS